MSRTIDLPDARSDSPDDYLRKDRRGQMKRSWALGVARQQDGRQTVRFRDGLTWGSIGQIMGYLLGDVDDALKNDLFERMLATYTRTDRGAPLAAAAPRVSLRVANWNLRYSAETHSWRRSDFLKALDWDIALLQEVSPKAWRVFQENGLAEGGVYTHDGFGFAHEGRRPNGVAILVRNGFVLRDPELLPDLPLPQRALSARVEGFAEPLKVMSWHAPHAAGGDRPGKHRAYRCVMEWLATTDDLIVLGCDANYWNHRTELDLPVVTPEVAAEDPVEAFFSANAGPNLQDTLLAYFRQDAEAYAEAVAARPNGPLAISYKRGSTYDRFDYVLVSPKFEVLACRYDYEGAKAAGSDHGIILADITLPG